MRHPVILSIICLFTIASTQDGTDLPPFEPKPLPENKVKIPTIRDPALNPSQISYLSPTGQMIVKQLYKEMFHSKATISNPERLAELTAYLYELLEWGTKGPPGGFSISKIPRFVAPVSNEQRKKRVKRAQHVGKNIQKKTEEMVNHEELYKKVVKLLDKMRLDYEVNTDPRNPRINPEFLNSRRRNRTMSYKPVLL